MDQFLIFSFCFFVCFALKWMIKALPTPGNWCACQHFTLTAQNPEYIHTLLYPLLNYRTFSVYCMREASGILGHGLWLTQNTADMISFLANFASTIFGLVPCGAAGAELSLCWYSLWWQAGWGTNVCSLRLLSSCWNMFWALGQVEEFIGKCSDGSSSITSQGILQYFWETGKFLGTGTEGIKFMAMWTLREHAMQAILTTSVRQLQHWWSKSRPENQCSV